MQLRFVSGYASRHTLSAGAGTLRSEVSGRRKARPARSRRDPCTFTLSNGASGSSARPPGRPRTLFVPVSNTEVKPRWADGTARESVWESRSLPAQIKATFLIERGLFRVRSCGAGAIARCPWPPDRRGQHECAAARWARGCSKEPFGREREALVGARGFEPRTPCAQGRCATRLRYAPTVFRL